VTFTVKIYF
jgi:hypothetical protein